MTRTEIMSNEGGIHGQWSVDLLAVNHPAVNEFILD